MALYSIRNLTVKFKSSPKDFVALDNVNINLPRVGLVSIVGKSGSGKSTFLNCLFGLIKPTSGDVFYNAKSLKCANKKWISTYRFYEVSIVFQHYNLFEKMDVISNVALPRFLMSNNKKKGLDDAQKLLDEFSLGYLKNKKVETLSGGEAQRVAILRSLINNPKVILADEPVGALDENNALFIMETFKKLSQNHLVIIVSHNEEMVKKYSDRIITFDEGRIVSDVVINEVKSNQPCATIKKNKRSNSWKNMFIFRFFKDDLSKNILSFFSLVFGFTSLLLSVGYLNGSKETKKQVITNNLASYSMTISAKTYIEIEGSPLRFEKSVRPSLSSLDIALHSSLQNVEIGYNANYVFSSFPYATYKNEHLETFEMVPLYNFDLTSEQRALIVGGDVKDDEIINDVIINTEMLALLKIDINKAINETITISNSSVIKHSTGNIENPLTEDDLSFVLPLNIVAVVKEFSFLNTPKVYYSHCALSDYLSNVTLKNYSAFINRDYSLDDALHECDDSNALSGYSYRLFALDSFSLNHLFALKNRLKQENNQFQIDSSVFEISSSYASFTDIFSLAFFVFVIIVFLGVNFVLGTSSYSSFLLHKKTSALLSCFGAKTSDIIDIFLNENLLIVLASSLLSFGLSILLSNIINIVSLNAFNISNIIAIPFLSMWGFPFLLPVMFLLLVTLVALLFICVPLLFYKRLNLVEELRDE